MYEKPSDGHHPWNLFKDQSKVADIEQSMVALGQSAGSSSMMILAYHVLVNMWHETLSKPQHLLNNK